MLYYPVPDYRYPVTLYSDDYLPQTGDVTNISARLDGPGLWFRKRGEAMANACRNGDFAKFTNSFLGMWEKGRHETDFICKIQSDQSGAVPAENRRS